jgi:hypothetical protein
VRAAYVPSAGADASPERRVAPRLDDNQDTKDEHQPRQLDERRQERRRRESIEKGEDADEKIEELTAAVERFLKV